MINRRLIRIKVFKVLYSNMFGGFDSVQEAQRQLNLSCQGTHQLYFFVLNLMVALRKAAEAKIENGLRKFNPTVSERNPNRKFIENKLLTYLENDTVFTTYCEKHALSWAGDDTRFVRKLMAQISEREYFQDYMSSGERSVAQDAELVANILANEVNENEELEEMLEEKSMYWMDDLTYVINVIFRSIDMFKTRKRIFYPDTFMKEDDREFAFRLLSVSMLHADEYFQLISRNVPNWDSERFVATDTVLISQGLAEAVAFEEIPVKVTINEYVEISKFYSTQNSKVFVNGLLDKLIVRLTQEHVICKQGRGLRES